ncbi:hypothetical protein BN1200_230075 [Klebsiella variicola]|nr:hypothetical protein BN1200_160117 [Klebsiella variicola]CTQ04527.1 hypothetical protein BN1200_230075 [Klebsiella variicola]CTQ12220.1 conserved hypothetical protein [Klebsiella variicola]CTQ13613.1 conserved hypothetical protein [Klebsiella variicola]CTQ24120.1 hypothetical protein BN1200_440007 [Klebsiella variicola]
MWLWLSRLALRLAGLQDHSRLLCRSPGKAFTPRPGKVPRVRLMSPYSQYLPIINDRE